MVRSEDFAEMKRDAARRAEEMSGEPRRCEEMRSEPREGPGCVITQGNTTYRQ